MKNKKKKQEKIISSKNYLYAILILIGGILLTLYIFKWYEVKKEEKLITSYLIKTKTISSNVFDLESLKQLRQESPSSYFIYFSYTNNENVYNLEKKLKRVIDKYKLNDIFYYVDMTKMMENNDYLEEIKKCLDINNLDNLPVIIYVHNGIINNNDILDGVNNNLLKVEDLENLLNIYEFEIVK